MIDYDALRSELAALEASAQYTQPQNPWASGNRGLAGFGPAQDNAKVWDAEQARRKASLEARKQYLRRMLASPESDPHGQAVRSAMGR